MLPVETKDVYTDFQSLTALGAKAARNDPKALEKVAEQFEAIFLQTMLKSMRNASLGDGIMDSDQTRFYQDMFDQQIAVDLAHKRQAGIAEMLVRQLGGQQVMDEQKEAALSYERLHYRRPLSATAIQAYAPPDPGVEVIKSFESPHDFVTKVWPLAEKAAKELGVAPDVLVAQSALETGWGKSVIRFTNGVNTHNLFNIKADQRWGGPRAVVPTLEYERGVPVMQNAPFRAYSTFKESFDDYVSFLKQSPRYAEALKNCGDSEKFVRSLHDAGYATDPEYANKISRLMRSGFFEEAVAEVKNSNPKPLT